MGVMMMKPYPPPESLKRRLTVAEAEGEMTARSAEYGIPLSPHWLERWNVFKSEVEAQDELWYFEYFPEPMTGGAGYCRVRNGIAVASIATMRA